MDFRERFHTQVKAAMKDFTDAQHLETVLLHDRWIPGRTLYLGDVVRHEGVLYEVKQPVVIALETQPPDAEGMLAVYRPIVLEAAGTMDDPIPFMMGMDVHLGLYYSYDGAVYIADADMLPCTWAPDSGIWQWKPVEDEAPEGDGETEPEPETEGEPETEAIPDWVQPYGAEGYQKGDKVRFDGKVWVSVFEGINVWQPGAYGWEEVEA